MPPSRDDASSVRLRQRAADLIRLAGYDGNAPIVITTLDTDALMLWNSRTSEC
jgi:hypothetical protein